MTRIDDIPSNEILNKIDEFERDVKNGGNVKNYKVCLESYLEKFPRNKMIAEKLVKLEITLGDYENGLKISEYVLGDNSIDLHFIFFKLYCLLKLDKKEEAIKSRNYYKEKRDLNKSSNSRYFSPYYPYIDNKTGCEVKHIMEFGKFSSTILKLKDDGILTKCNKVKSFLIVKKYREADNELNELLKKYPENMIVLETACKSFSQIHNNIKKLKIDSEMYFIKKGLSIAKKILQIDKNESIGDFYVRYFLRRLHDWKSLESYLNSTNFPVSTNQMLEPQEKQLKFENALNIINKSPKSPKSEINDRETLIKKIELTRKLKHDNTQNFNELLQILENNVRKPETYLNKKFWNLFIAGNILIELGKFDEAIEKLDFVAKIRGDEYVKNEKKMAIRFKTDPEFLKMHKFLSSSSKYSAEYDEKSEILELRFMRGGFGCSNLYRYFDVPKNEFDLILEVKGNTVNHFKYKFEKI